MADKIAPSGDKIAPSGDNIVPLGDKIAPDFGAVLGRIMREDRGRLLAALIAHLGDFQMAEDCLQDAGEAALKHWPRGLPQNPHGWLLRVAQRKALDRLRRAKNFTQKTRQIAVLMAEDEIVQDAPEIPDERLALIFTCCHPALDAKSRVALTLRMLGGLSTGEIAHAFLDNATTMGQRLSRAKGKIAAAGIPFKIPDEAEWDARLGSVLAVIYLIFNEGYSVSEGAELQRHDLCEEAIYLARMLCELRPEAAESWGLLSLVQTIHARRFARVDKGGDLVDLAHQNRADWDAELGARGLSALDHALELGQSGPYQIKAAISALHMQAPRFEDTDWGQMALLYEALLRFEETDVVRLNLASVVCQISGPKQALVLLAPLGETLQRYQPYHATMADILYRDGQHAAAIMAYDRAIDLSGTDAQKRYLSAQKSRIH